MIYEKSTRVDDIPAAQAGEEIAYAGTLGLLRLLTTVAMLAVLTALAQAGLRPLPWTTPMPGWLMLVYLLGAGLFYAATHLRRIENNLLIGISLVFDLGMLIGISLFSDGALALFPLAIVLVISIHRTLMVGLLAGAVYAAHLFLIWPPGRGYDELQTPFQMILLVLTLAIILLWVGLAAHNNVHLTREQWRSAVHREKTVQDRKRRLEVRARSLYNISYTLSATLNFETLMRSVFEELLKALPLDAAMVLLVDSENNKLNIASQYGLRPQELEHTVDLRTGQLGRTVAKGVPAVITELKSESELAAVWPRLAEMDSCIVIPLRSRFELFGMLLLFRQNGQYDAEDLDFMSVVGNNAIVTLQNAQLAQTLRSERDRLMTKEEEIRRQLARELHDGPAQTLAVIAMKGEFVKKLFDIAPASGLRELDELGSIARKANQELRSMLFDLRPAILETQGLIPALQNYVQRFPANEAPLVHLQATDLPVRLPQAAETAIFDVVQEAITNARKHARARNIWVSIQQNGDRIQVLIQDDGQGFEVATQREAAIRNGSYGLVNMRERSTAIDGDFSIGSIAGRGTTVALSVPVHS